MSIAAGSMAGASITGGSMAGGDTAGAPSRASACCSARAWAATYARMVSVSSGLKNCAQPIIPFGSSAPSMTMLFQSAALDSAAERRRSGMMFSECVSPPWQREQYTR
jgi:hypothetical protein